MALMETKPALRSLRIVGPKASARTSATRLLVSPLSVLPRIQAPKHPHYSGAMPPTASGGWYPPSVQLFRQRPARYEAGRHKLPNGPDQIEGAGICSLLVRKCITVYARSARQSFVIRLVHFAIMAGS